MRRKKYTLPELIKLWEREELTVEQAIGQTLLWLTALSDRVTRLEATQPQNNNMPQTGR